MRRAAHAAPGEGAATSLLAGQVDRHAALHPDAVGLIDVRLMTQARSTTTLGSGDARPPTLRPGALDCARLPSRIGNRLHWPDGQRTPIAAAAQLAAALFDRQTDNTQCVRTQTRPEALAEARQIAVHFALTAADLGHIQTPGRPLDGPTTQHIK